MKPAKLSVLFCTFSYGGNGGIASGHPDVFRWISKTALEIPQDPRVGRYDWLELHDTPITMTRNRSVLEARKVGADVIVMIDSDMAPDYLVGKEPGAKPFFWSSFDFLYERLLRGKHSVVVAPYCGPSPDQMVYVFRWRNKMSGKNFINHDLQLDAFTREEAAVLGGIQEVGSGPTGLSMYSTGIFEFSEPQTPTDRYETLEEFRQGRIDAQECLRRLGQQYWFDYTFDKYGAHKTGTEDVVALRDLAICTWKKAGYNPLFCNWDAWAGHWKPERVGKPEILTIDNVGQKFVDAVHQPSQDTKLVEVDFSNEEISPNWEPPQQMRTAEQANQNFGNHVDRGQVREVLSVINTNGEPQKLHPLQT